MGRRAWLAVALVGLALGPAGAAPLTHWDFESGDRQGWQVAWGNLGPQPVSQDNDRWGGNFGKQGRYFIGTCELPSGGFDDSLTGELRSPTFTLHARRLRLRVGGGAGPEVYVALVRRRDGEELCRAAGRNQEAMHPVTWEVSAWLGTPVFLRVVDRATGGWGHLNVDDIRELGPQEEAAEQRAGQAAARERAARIQHFRESLLAPARRHLYRGQALADLAMPLGGIGAGSIALGGRGDLREWQIFNTANSSCVVPGGFFAVRAVREGGRAVARLLQLDGIGRLPAIQEIEFIGEYPIAELRYRDAALPVQVALEAFSPFVPLQAQDSALPAIVFCFRVANPGRERVQVSLLACCQNAVGYDGRSPITADAWGQVLNPGYGGNLNQVVRRPGWLGVEMRAPGMAREAKHYGSLTLGTTAPGAAAAAGWSDPAGLWRRFGAGRGFGGEGEAGPTAPGRTLNCAVAVPLELGPGESGTATFILAWHFPNHYADYQESLAGYRLGHMYSNWFADAAQAAGYVADHLERLAGETRRFRQVFYDSTLPYWLLDCVSSQISTLRSQTVLWIEDGTFAAFEGGWCCPMNCTHVWNYEQTLAKLFPALERNMRDTDFGVQQDESGFIHHRTVLPLSLPRASGPFCDGHLGCIMKAYREHLQASDGGWLADKWPRVRRAMDWALQAYDPDGNGLIEGEQWNTYDLAFQGPNPFTGTWFLGALRAAAEMARECGDEASAERYRVRFEAGRAALEGLWNGEYYVQRVPPGGERLQFGEGCLSDQMLGQWFAQVTGLGYLLPPERVRGALRAVLEHNFRWDLSEHEHSQRVFAAGTDMGLLVCTWPRGGRPAEPMYYCDEVWTGIEYQVASHLIYEGMVPEAYQVVRAARNRADGVPRPPFKRNPWNEIECGEHYARAMSSWALLLAAQGYWYHGPQGILQLTPRISPEHHRSLFTTAQGYGTFAQERRRQEQTDRLLLHAGTLELRQLVLEAPSGWGRVTVTAPGGAAARAEREGGRVTLRFARPVTLGAGEALEVHIRR